MDYFVIPDSVKRSREVEAAEAVDLARFTLGAIGPREAMAQDPEAVTRGSSDVVGTRAIRRQINRLRFGLSAELTVEGVFFPAVLLYTGWWERQRPKKFAEEIIWKDDRLDQLKCWLFSGFKQWGPSCDFNPAGGLGEQYVLGQIGEMDEADSVLLIVAGCKAEDLRAQLASGAHAFNVQARGFLQHCRDLTDRELRDRIKAWGKLFNYCLFVSANEPAHFAIPRGRPGLYSGYLWQCWLPAGLAEYSGETENGIKLLMPPRIDEVYFLWEHTNFANKDAVEYNLDSLRHKKEFIGSRLGDLILVQKSSPLVEGEQALRKDDFYKFVVEPRRAAEQRHDAT